MIDIMFWSTVLLPHVVHYELKDDAHARVIEYHHREQDGEVQGDVQRTLSSVAGDAVTECGGVVDVSGGQSGLTAGGLRLGGYLGWLSLLH